MRMKKNLNRNTLESVTMTTENEEDVWIVYNLLQVGDEVECVTRRKIITGTNSETGKNRAAFVRTSLAIEVKAIDFDAKASIIYLKGRIAVENGYVKIGTYHSLQIGQRMELTVSKESWDSVALSLLDQASDPTQQSDLAAVIMHEGLAHLCLITGSATHICAKIECAIPHKRTQLPTTQHDKVKKGFFDQIIQAIEREVNFDMVKYFIVASPGFLKDQFLHYLFQEVAYSSEQRRVLLENKSKFMQVHSSSGHKHALKEVLTDPTVTKKIANSKAAAEINALNDFYMMLKKDQSRAFYGVKHVEKAVEAYAVETLLISDALFRSNNLEERRRYVRMVDSVKENMGTVYIFSSLHVSGEQLTKLSGIAAILRFPIPEPESDDSDDSDAEMQTA
ncbi:hypothetical protein Aperf_G00000128579 [Anoplocephala perfoliata]